MPPAAEVLLVFLRLGVTSFGGPVAHLGYFRDELVVRRRWLDDAAFARLVGMCGLLPGPTSSQVGFALGWRRAGPLGALAAFVGFTLPSALVMAMAAVAPTAVPEGVVHQLRLLACAVVMGAVVAMARALPRHVWRYGVAVGGAALSVLAPATLATSAAVGVGAVVGAFAAGRGAESPPDPSSPVRASPVPISPRLAAVLLGLFVAGCLGSALDAGTDGAGPQGRALAALYTSGALVFGGGHVVLPLLHGALVVPGLVSEDSFLAGYGLVQAMPGPLFSFAAYLGQLTGGIRGAILGTVALFAPGLLLVGPALLVGDTVAAHPRTASGLSGAAAAVVGVLAVAAADLAWSELVRGASPLWLNGGAVLLYGLLLGPGRRPPWQVVLLAGIGGWWWSE